MSTSYTIKRNGYLKENASCDACDIKSCANRKRPCPYFQPNVTFTQAMIKAIGSNGKAKK